MQALKVQGSEEDIKDARADRLPEINVEGAYAYASNIPVYENGLLETPTQLPAFHTYYRFGGDAYFNLYNGGKTNIKIKERQTIRQIDEEEKNLTISEIKLRASALFLGLHRSLIFKQLLFSDIDDKEKQLAHIRQLQKNGVVLKSDVLRAELQLSNQKLSLTQIENDIAIASQKLNILMGQPDSLLIYPEMTTDADTSLLKPSSEYLEDALHHAYQNKISARETELKRLQLQAVKANLSPKIGLFGTYAYTYPQTLLYPYSGNLFGLGMAGISASFPISAFYQNRHKVKASEWQLKQQELEQENTRDGIRQQVTEAYLRYQEAVNRISVAKTNITRAVENSRIVNNTYFNQLSLITDLLEANTELLQARFDLVSAQIAAQMQYYQLLNATANF